MSFKLDALNNINYSYFACMTAAIGLILILALSVLDLFLISKYSSQIIRILGLDDKYNESSIKEVVKKDIKSNTRCLIAIIISIALLIYSTIL